MQTQHLLLQVMVDFHACRWPPHIPSSHDTSIAEYFDNLNEPALSNLAENLEMEEEETGHRPPLLTFSHFLPLQVHLQNLCIHVALRIYALQDLCMSLSRLSPKGPWSW